jgi:hypothetical protein
MEWRSQLQILHEQIERNLRDSRSRDLFSSAFPDGDEYTAKCMTHTFTPEDRTGPSLSRPDPSKHFSVALLRSHALRGAWPQPPPDRKRLPAAAAASQPITPRSAPAPRPRRVRTLASGQGGARLMFGRWRRRCAAGGAYSQRPVAIWLTDARAPRSSAVVLRLGWRRWVDCTGASARLERLMSQADALRRVRSIALRRSALSRWHSLAEWRVACQQLMHSHRTRLLLTRALRPLAAAASAAGMLQTVIGPASIRSARQAAARSLLEWGAIVRFRHRLADAVQRGSAKRGRACLQRWRRASRLSARLSPQPLPPPLSLSAMFPVPLANDAVAADASESTTAAAATVCSGGALATRSDGAPISRDAAGCGVCRPGHSVQFQTGWAWEMRHRLSQLRRAVHLKGLSRAKAAARRTDAERWRATEGERRRRARALAAWRWRASEHLRLGLASMDASWRAGLIALARWHHVSAERRERHTSHDACICTRATRHHRPPPPPPPPPTAYPRPHHSPPPPHPRPAPPHHSLRQGRGGLQEKGRSRPRTISAPLACYAPCFPRRVAPSSRGPLVPPRPPRRPLAHLIRPAVRDSPRPPPPPWTAQAAHSADGGRQPPLGSRTPSALSCARMASRISCAAVGDLPCVRRPARVCGPRGASVVAGRCARRRLRSHRRLDALRE